MPARVHRLTEGQRQRRERVPLSVQVTMDKFTTYSFEPMLVWCRAMLDGQPLRPPSLCSRFSVFDLMHAQMVGLVNFFFMYNSVPIVRATSWAPFN